MGLWSKPRLKVAKAIAFLGGILAPPSAQAALSLGNSSYAMFISTDKMTPAPLENSTGTITPPLTRPPSLENAGALITSSSSPWDDDETVLVTLPPQHILDFNVPSPPPLAHTAYDDNAAAPPWLPEIVAALMLAVKFLLAPLGARGRRRECRRGDAGHDPGDTGDARDPPRSTLWNDMKDAAGRMLDTARSSLRAVAGRIDDLFDNPDARRDRLVKLASAFQVFDMSPRHGHERHDSGQLIEVDRTRLTPERDVSMGVQMVCRQACAMFPEVGYNQGFDAACKAIYISVGKNAVAALEIFTKWAVPVAWLLFNEYVVGEHRECAVKPALAYTWRMIEARAAPVFGWLSRDPVVGRHDQEEMLESVLEHVFFEPLTTFCSRLGFGKSVMNDILEETMKAGVHGPAVSLYVVMCLLCVAERDGAERVDEITMVKVHMKAAASKTRSFKALRNQAPVTLEDFVAGYRDAMVRIPVAEEQSE